MRRTWRMAAWIGLLAAGLLLTAVSGSAGNGTVAVIPVHGNIEPGMKNFVVRSLEEAEAAGAAAVILELNTPGGYIDSAKAIRGAMDDFSAPIYTLVRTDAISAGAYLALAADAIYMVPGSTMGAAELRTLGGGQADEKEISVWEKELVGLAERNDRDPEVASAMVRREVSIEGLVERGALLTLTASEALAVGYSEGTVENRAELLAAVNLSGASLQEYGPTFTDHMVSWVTRPYIAIVLLIIGFGGLVLEVLTSGFGGAGLVSMLAFALYFSGHIAAGLAEYWVAILFVAGVVLLLVEAFIPGIGIFGISGLVATITSIILAAASVRTGVMMLAISLVLAGVFTTLAFRFFASRGALRHIFLSEEERPELGYVASVDRKGLLGLEGTAITPLRPAGAAEIEGQRVDVVSEGGFVPAGDTVKVVFVEGVRVVVRPVGPAHRQPETPAAN